MGEGRSQSCLPRFGQGRVRATLSVDTGEAQPPPDRHPGRSPLALTALALTSAVLTLGALTACSGGTASTPSASSGSSATSPALSTRPAAAPQRLSETGSSLMAPLFALWGPAYHAQFSQLNISTASTSSGTGISSAAAGTADIGASDAYLSPADVSEHTNLVNIPLAVAALMVIYHVPGVSPSTHLRLNGQVLARIFDGTITTWNDPAIRNLNPGVTLPGTAIVLVHRADTSGSTFLFTSYLNAQDPAEWGSSLIGTAVAWPQQPGEQGAQGSSGIIRAVRATPGSIGYVGVSYLATVTRDGEGEVALGNSAGNYVLPTASTIQAGLASFTNTPPNETISLVNGSGPQVYPIINYEYAIVSISQATPTRAQDLRAFLDWAIGTGTAQLAQVNFQPLPPSVVTLSQAQIAKIKG
jgi:phosphate transport system substrate-binding protein